MRVTQQIAIEVAEKLTTKHLEAIEVVKKELDEIVVAIAMNKLPTKVLETFEKYPQYFDTTSTVVLTGAGFNNDTMQVSKSIPKLNDNWRHLVEVPTKVSSKVTSLWNKIDNLTKQHKQLKENIKATLLNLRSYKKVELEFPEAFEHLPEVISQSLAININELRKQLN